jgi:hypothetical protein
MQARERAGAALKARVAERKAEWQAWHVAHPEERWAPGEKEARVGELIVGLVFAGAIALLVIIALVNNSSNVKVANTTPTYDYSTYTPDNYSRAPTSYYSTTTVTTLPVTTPPVTARTVPHVPVVLLKTSGTVAGGIQDTGVARVVGHLT